MTPQGHLQRHDHNGLHLFGTEDRRAVGRRLVELTVQPLRKIRSHVPTVFAKLRRRLVAATTDKTSSADPRTSAHRAPPHWRRTSASRRHRPPEPPGCGPSATSPSSQPTCGLRQWTGHHCWSRSALPGSLFGSPDLASCHRLSTSIWSYERKTYERNSKLGSLPWRQLGRWRS